MQHFLNWCCHKTIAFMKKNLSIVFAIIFLGTVFLCCNKTEGKRLANIESDGILLDLTGKLDGCGFVVKLNNGSSLEIRNIPAGITLADNKKVHIKYNVVNGLSICMIGDIADITELKYL